MMLQQQQQQQKHQHEPTSRPSTSPALESSSGSRALRQHLQTSILPRALSPPLSRPKTTTTAPAKRLSSATLQKAAATIRAANSIAAGRPATAPVPARRKAKKASSAIGANAMANPLRYWDALAQKGWEEEVLSTIDSDKKQVLRSVINEYASAARQSASAESETVAFDFGAGSGRYLHSLAPAFDRVIAVDISPKLVDMMQALVGSNGWTHVQCGVEDLARPTLRGVYPRAHFGVCANVLLSPDTSHHTAIMQEVARRLVPGAALLVVAPSTEAALYIRQRLVDARLEKPMTPKAAADGIANGVFKRGGVRTKHWLREELELFARRCGFRLERIGKVEFGWASEVDDERLRKMGVPLSLNVPPHPWDHLAIFRRLADGTNGVEPKPEGLLSIRSDFEARGCLTSCMLSRGGDNEAAV